LKKLILKCIFLAVISAVPLVAYNIIVDPYLVLRKDVEHMFICPNERYFKTDFILRNPEKYNSFLFGSSRVSQVPVETIDKTTGERFYNMTYISGVTSDHLAILKLFIDKKIKIKNVVVGLDYYTFTAMPIENQTRNIMYPGKLREKVKFYYTYLTLEPDSSMLKEIKFNGKDAAYDLTGTGGYRFIKRERLMALDPLKHEAKFKNPSPVLCTDQLEKTLGEISEIIAVCKRNGINLKFFINPDYLSMYLCQDIVFINLARSRLAALTDFWDFSVPSPIIGEKFNFIDPIHYRQKTGSMMVDKMYGLNAGIRPDFGFLVTKANVKRYVEKAAEDFARYKKQVQPDCMPCKKSR
jgi:hypothetical protein